MIQMDNISKNDLYKKHQPKAIYRDWEDQWLRYNPNVPGSADEILLIIATTRTPHLKHCFDVLGK
jgi:hypothetical protein